MPVVDTNLEGGSQRLETARAIETVLTGNKPPWRPKVAGYVALFLGPIAGAFVVAVSFRKMGQPQKAQQTVFYTLLLCIAFLIPFLLGIPADAPIKKIILLAVEGAGYSVFPSTSGVTQNRPCVVTSKPAMSEARDIDSDRSPYRLLRHEQCLERRKETTSHSTGEARMAVTAHRASHRCP